MATPGFSIDQLMELAGVCASSTGIHGTAGADRPCWFAPTASHTPSAVLTVACGATSRSQRGVCDAQGVPDRHPRPCARRRGAWQQRVRRDDDMRHHPRCGRSLTRGLRVCVLGGGRGQRRCTGGGSASCGECSRLAQDILCADNTFTLGDGGLPGQGGGGDAPAAPGAEGGAVDVVVR